MCSPIVSADTAVPGPTFESTTTATSSFGWKNVSAVNPSSDPPCSKTPESGWNHQASAMSTLAFIVAWTWCDTTIAFDSPSSRTRSG